MKLSSTFYVPILPNSVKAGCLDIPIVPYIPNPLRCFKCNKFWHGQNTCRNKLTCARCGQFDHESKACQNDMACTNCGGKHFAYSRECQKWKLEKMVQQVKVERNVSFTEARKVVESFPPAVKDKSYAAAVKVSTSNIAIQTDLTWSNGEDKYKKISDIEKQNTRKNRLQKHINKILRQHICLWMVRILQKAWLLGNQARVSLDQEDTNNLNKDSLSTRLKPLKSS